MGGQSHNGKTAKTSMHLHAEEAHRKDRENGDDEEVQDKSKQPPMRRQPPGASTMSRVKKVWALVSQPTHILTSWHWCSREAHVSQCDHAVCADAALNVKQKF